MRIPGMIGIVIIFCFWLQYEIRKTKRIEKNRQDLFWKKEQEANLTRRVDISALNYITIPLPSLPMSDHDDFIINSCRDKILTLSEQKILNLSGYTNTELKLKYGAPNIKILTECDNNYTLLVRTLHQWGERYHALGQNAQALSILEFAASCHTDVSKTYLLLAAVYKSQNDSAKIDVLISRLGESKTGNKDKLIHDLEMILKC